MEKPSMIRTKAFRWHTRQELYKYFKKSYDIDKSEVDLEIQRVMATFRPRKGQHIHTPELWEKVGIDLEHSLRRIETLAKECDGDIVIDVSLSDSISFGKDPARIDIENLPPQPVINSEELIVKNEKKSDDTNEDVAYLDKL